MVVVVACWSPSLACQATATATTTTAAGPPGCSTREMSSTFQGGGSFLQKEAAYKLHKQKKIAVEMLAQGLLGIVMASKKNGKS